MNQRIQLRLLIFCALLGTAWGQRLGPIEVFLGGSGYLGVTIRDVERADVDKLRLDREAGVVVSAVSPDSPAEKAGLDEDDVILSVSGIPVLSVRQFQRLIADIPAGREIQLTVSRDGSQLTPTVELADRSQSYRHFYDGPPAELFERLIPRFRFDDRGLQGDVITLDNRPRLGIQGQEITQQLADFLGVERGKGVLVMEVLEDSSAHEARLMAGDVIIGIDGHEVDDLTDLTSHLEPGSHNLRWVRAPQLLPRDRTRRGPAGPARSG